MNFRDYILENRERIALYSNTVVKVHGNNHPEYREVHALYEKIVNKLNANETNLAEVFEALRNITSNYTVPKDVCETYEAMYKYLEEADRLYNAEYKSEL